MNDINTTEDQELMKILLSDEETNSDTDSYESEGDLLREKMRQVLEMLRKERKKKRKREAGGAQKKVKFKVEKGHPMFSGKPEDLDQFIMKMELQYEEYTDSVQREAHNPNFICKLGGHFEKELGADWWFYTWARGIRKANQPCTWNSLVEAMRKHFGGVDQQRIRFNEFIDLKQGLETVSKYMAQKAKIALQCEALNDNIEMYGFIRGLRPDIHSYVNLQRPQSLGEAQQHALTFEASMATNGQPQRSALRQTPSGTNNGGTKSGKSVKNSGTGSGTSGKETTKNRDSKKLSPRQQEALEELRQLRKNKCFACGNEGHQSRDCSAPQATKDSHQERINKLKGILRQ